MEQKQKDASLRAGDSSKRAQDSRITAGSFGAIVLHSQALSDEPEQSNREVSVPLSPRVTPMSSEDKR